MRKVLLESIYWFNDEYRPFVLPFILHENESELISLYNGERVTIKKEYDNFMVDCKNSLINHYKRDIPFSQHVCFSDCNTFLLKHEYLMPLALKFATISEDKETLDQISKYTSTHYASEEFLKSVNKKYRSQNYKHTYNLER